MIVPDPSSGSGVAMPNEYDSSRQNTVTGYVTARSRLSITLKLQCGGSSGSCVTVPRAIR